MGHEIESAALERGHNIVMVIDKDNTSDIDKLDNGEIDAVIEFTLPDSAFENIIKCLRLGIPVVSGTTGGWMKDLDKAEQACLEHGTSFIHSTNFSIGVNILFRLNMLMAEYVGKYTAYSPAIEERHHVKKIDAPSGTAITLAGDISRLVGRYKGWRFSDDEGDDFIPIRSIREGFVPGTHMVTWDSGVDTLSLRHEAKSRRGLALGAVMAAEFISARKGVFTMGDVLGF